MGNNVPSNKRMVDQMVDHSLRSARVEGAFRAVDRAMYYKMSDATVDPYADQPWRNGHLHLSAPCIYAKVVQALDLEPGMSFLNLGSGTGYLSTIVGLLIGPNGLNHGVELHAEVIEYAQKRLDKFMATSSAIDKFDFVEPTFVKGNCVNLDPSLQYDRVYLGASCLPDLAPFMKKLIKPNGGILVMPYEGNLIRYTRTGENEWDQEKLFRVDFTEMVAQQYEDDKRQIEMPRPSARSLKELCRIVIRQQLRLKTNLMHPNLLNSDNVDRRRYRRSMASLAMRRVEERRQQARLLHGAPGGLAYYHNHHSHHHHRHNHQTGTANIGICCRRAASASSANPNNPELSATRRQVILCTSCSQKQQRRLAAARDPSRQQTTPAASSSSAETRMMTRLAMRQMKSATRQATAGTSSSSRAEATSDQDAGPTENEDDDDEEDEDSEMAFYPSNARRTSSLIAQHHEGPSRTSEASPVVGASGSSTQTSRMDQIERSPADNTGDLGRQGPPLVAAGAVAVTAADESAGSARGHEADLSSLSSSMSSYSDEDEENSDSDEDDDDQLFLDANGRRRPGGGLRLSDGWAEFLALATGDGDESNSPSSSSSSSLSSLDSFCLSLTSSSVDSSDAEASSADSRPPMTSASKDCRPLRKVADESDEPVARRLRSKRLHLDPQQPQRQQEASSSGSSSSFHSAVSTQQNQSQQQRAVASTSTSSPTSQGSCCANSRRCCRQRARKCRWLKLNSGPGSRPEVGRLQPMAGHNWHQLSPTPDLSISRRILLATGYNLHRNGTSLTLAGGGGGPEAGALDRQAAANLVPLQHMRQPILFMNALARSSGDNWGRSWRSITLRSYMEAHAGSGAGQRDGNRGHQRTNAAAANQQQREPQQSSQQRHASVQLQHCAPETAAGPSSAGLAASNEGDESARLRLSGPAGARKRKRRASSQSGDDEASASATQRPSTPPLTPSRLGDAAAANVAAVCSRRCRRCRAWARPAINFANDTFHAASDGAALGSAPAAAAPPPPPPPRVIMLDDDERAASLSQRRDPPTLDQPLISAPEARRACRQGSWQPLSRFQANSCNSITASGGSTATSTSTAAAAAATATTTPAAIVPDSGRRATCQHHRHHHHHHRRCCHNHSHCHHGHQLDHHSHRHHAHSHRHHHRNCSLAGQAQRGNCGPTGGGHHGHCRRHHAICRHRAQRAACGHGGPLPHSSGAGNSQQQQQQGERLAGDFHMRRRVERERRLAGLTGGRPHRKTVAPQQGVGTSEGPVAGNTAAPPPRARRPANECEKYRNHISGYIRRLDLPRALHCYLNYGRDFHLS